MAAAEPSARRTQAVRLADVPFEVRMRAARMEARRAKTVKEAEELLAAAFEPSDRVFYIRSDADVDEDLRQAA
jgi:hypothetical protein